MTGDSTSAGGLVPHRLSWADFDGLTQAEGGPRIMAELRRAERSRRLLLLRALVDEAGKTPELPGPLPPPEDAWELLARVEEKDPAVLDLMLAHPYTGTWAGYTMRLLRRRISGVSPLWVHVGHVHALAAAAAIRAGLSCHTLLPVYHDGVILPTLGFARVHGAPAGLVAELTATPGRVELSDRPIGRRRTDSKAPPGAQSAAGETASAGEKVAAGVRTPVTPPTAPPPMVPPPSVTRVAAHPGPLQLGELGHLTDLLLAIREIRSPSQWQLFLDTLPDAVSQSVPRQASGRLEVISLLRTCEDYPGAWAGLDTAIRLLAPQSAAAAAFLAELRRLGLSGEQGGPA